MPSNARNTAAPRVPQALAIALSDLLWRTDSYACFAGILTLIEPYVRPESTGDVDGPVLVDVEVVGRLAAFLTRNHALPVLPELLATAGPYLVTPQPQPELPAAAGDDVAAIVFPLGVTLREREMQVLVGMADGLSNRAIGRRHFISEDTVKTYCRRLFRKLGVGDRAHAVRRGYDLGLLIPECLVERISAELAQAVGS